MVKLIQSLMTIDNAAKYRQQKLKCGREFTLESLCRELQSDPDTVLPFLTPENGFFLHSGFWTYNPLGEWLYTEYAKQAVGAEA